MATSVSVGWVPTVLPTDDVGVMSCGLETTGLGPLEQPAVTAASAPHSKKILMSPESSRRRMSAVLGEAERIAREVCRQEIFAVQTPAGEEIKRIADRRTVDEGFCRRVTCPKS